jgi:hypothetical protein
MEGRIIYFILICMKSKNKVINKIINKRKNKKINSKLLLKAIHGLMFKKV